MNKCEDHTYDNIIRGDGCSEQMVDAQRLLQLLWDDKSRPSLRWLREQQRRRAIPYVKLGARVWFLPSEVRRHLSDKWTIKRRN